MVPSQTRAIMARSMLAYALLFSQFAMVSAVLSSPKVAPRFTTQPSPSYTSLHQQLPLGATQGRTGSTTTVGRMIHGHYSHQQVPQQRARECKAHQEPSVTGLSLSDPANSQQQLDDFPCDRKSWFTPRFAALSVSALVAGLTVAVLAPGPAAAAVKAIVAGSEDEAHLHLGQKIANFFRGGGLPDWATLMTISAMPVVELRGGIPVGIWMGMPIAKVFGLCVAGNMIPIPIILLALRSSLVQKLAKPILDRAREKAAAFGDEKSQALALTLFVGIPLPGTGAWTGAMGAFLLGMPFQKAILSIFFGVVSAGVIMGCLTLAGKAGALLATAVLAVFCVTSIVGGNKGGKEDILIK